MKATIEFSEIGVPRWQTISISNIEIYFFILRKSLPRSLLAPTPEKDTIPEIQI